MTNKKIAFVTNFYIDNNFSSGGVKLNYILLNGLKHSGYTIDLFADRKSIEHPEIFDKVFCFNEIENFRADYDFVLSDKACVPSDITYIHDHSYTYRVKMMSTPLRYFFYKIFCYKHHRRRLSEFYKTKENICKCRKVIASSEILKRDILNNYGVQKDRLEIIPPPVERYQIKKYKNGIFTFGISALGFARKGGYLLFRAIKELKKKNIKFKVIFIYPSNNIAVRSLVKLYRIEEFCEFTGRQNDMGRFYNLADCILMPSLIEPFGMVAAEALSVGCPVITAGHCGAADYIKNGVNGYLYECNSSENLAEAMVTDLGNLESISGAADFSNSHVADLGNLKAIGRDAYFEDSHITDLRNLESISGSIV